MVTESACRRDRVSRDEPTSEQASPEDLLSRYVEGDTDAFDELFRRFHPRLRAFFRRRVVLNETEVEDLTQITLLKLHQGRARYCTGQPLEPWLFTIARNAFRDHCRRKKTRLDSLTATGSVPEYAVNRRPPHPSMHPSLVEHRMQLESLLATLPELQRTAITMTQLRGYSLEEAAQRLNTTRMAVKLRVFRGYQNLRTQKTIS